MKKDRKNLWIFIIILGVLFMLTPFGKDLFSILPISEGIHNNIYNCDTSVTSSHRDEYTKSGRICIDESPWNDWLNTCNEMTTGGCPGHTIGTGIIVDGKFYTPSTMSYNSFLNAYGQYFPDGLQQISNLESFSPGTYEVEVVSSNHADQGYGDVQVINIKIVGVDCTEDPLICGEGSKCVEGLCVKIVSCIDVGCPENYECIEETGACKITEIIINETLVTVDCLTDPDVCLDLGGVCEQGICIVTEIEEVPSDYEVVDEIIYEKEETKEDSTVYVVGGLVALAAAAILL